ncbi:hypothetical protein O6P43_021406 [Quillaja saponaria]|uniref:Uncharacterized protein n=1 Tax=Quillaja saponaria TaxID=32244 RepID=A0AAD7LAR1_QUISA|nr:hypothetical protein O6P43_021406 [Quillaja saponaria]
MMFSNGHWPNFNFQAPTMPALARGINAFHGGPSQLIVAPALQQTQQIASFPRDNIGVAPQQYRAARPVPVQQSRPRMMMEELPTADDCTMPLFKYQLERPIKRIKMVGDFGECDIADHVNNLDLSLKL